ncbi:MAG: hypothetical protein AVDCRST_MAG90-2992 [uncultured Microvirga sp.]|uniref:Uncharacterized protein n=1 Tax=uncultured Microvirga sp. TaxID=412392 RepID=A0A6J4MKE0_9HYPH|nr:MAG: hypothetical protein AVDCRST_MAG90-2992 [uncultured Microvirga sp.]
MQDRAPDPLQVPARVTLARSDQLAGRYRCAENLANDDVR